MAVAKLRTEHDSLGDVSVPVDALYGAQTQRAVDNFVMSGEVLPRSFLCALGLIKYACAQVNGELQLLEPALCEAIAEASLAVAEGKHDSHFPVDVFQTGSGTSTNMNANEVIARLASDALKAPVHPNDHVNKGQSSNDVIPTCIHVSASIELQRRLIPALTQLREVISAKGDSLQGVVKTGRTHLMDAMPLTFAQEFSGWAAQVSANIERLENTLPRINQIALGATAVGTGLNSHPEYSQRTASVLATLCGIEFVPKRNSFEALSCQDTALELSGQLKTTAASLMKIANDLRWLSSGPGSGLNEINLPELQPGSSIMPGKINPVMPEAVAMAAAQVMGNDTTITIAAQSGNFQLNVMLPVIAFNLLQSIELLTNSAHQLAVRVIPGISVNEEKIAAELSRNPILVTALTQHLGYEKCAEIAKNAFETKRPILEVALEHSNLDEHTLKRLLDPRRMC